MYRPWVRLDPWPAKPMQWTEQPIGDPLTIHSHGGTQHRHLNNPPGDVPHVHHT
jgi:hypothetical protein